MLVAVSGHRIVGTGRGVRVGTDWYVGRLGVVPDPAEQRPWPPGIARFTLTTGPKSVENRAFYERHGYRRIPDDDELVHLAKPAAA